MGRVERVVAVELTRKGFAFGVLEGEERLIDWGTRESGRDVARLLPALRSVTERYRPDRLVLEEPAGSPKKRGGRTLLAWIEQWACDSELPVVAIENEALHRYAGSDRRYEVACRAARQFEVLQPYLPDKRRRWESERPMLGAFIAVARGLASYREE